MRLLLIVADARLRAELQAALAPAQHDLVHADGAAGGLEQALVCEPDAIVIGTQLPRPGGVATCRELRSAGCRAPILLVSLEPDVSELEIGLKSGADDYLAVPFDGRELRARLLALTRRRAHACSGRQLVCADIALDPVARTVQAGGRPVKLTPLEYRILELLMLNPGRVMSAETIYERAWTRQGGRPSNAVRLYVGYVRRKLERHGSARIIHTVRGVGYIMRPDGASALRPAGTRSTSPAPGRSPRS